MKKETKKVEAKVESKPKRKMVYGVQKIKTGAKVCWLSHENKFGWSLGLVLGKRTVWLRNLRFKTVEEVERVTKSNVVFVHKANKKK